MATAKKKGLGRGLEVLISGGVKRPAEQEQPKKVEPSKSTPSVSNNDLPSPEGFLEIPISKVVPNPHQPRRDIEQAHIAHLAESIRSEGLLQPIVVRAKDKKFELIAGERRWRACQSLGMKTILARVVNVSEASSAVIALIENLQRENLNPIEESLGYASLMRDFDLTQEAVAERVGKPRSSVANALRLLQLDREIQGYISKGMLSVGHAKVLLGLEQGEQQVIAARRIIERGMSVRETERLVQSLKRGRSALDEDRRPAVESAAIKDIERRMERFLSTKVQVKHNPKKGRITIDYFGNEDLERILEKLGLTEKA